MTLCSGIHPHALKSLDLMLCAYELSHVSQEPVGLTDDRSDRYRAARRNFCTQPDPAQNFCATPAQAQEGTSWSSFANFLSKLRHLPAGIGVRSDIGWCTA
jgi:hypothetical protein